MLTNHETICDSHYAAPAGAAPPGFIELFLNQVAETPDAVAIEVHDAHGKVTYRELLNLIERYRAAFEDLGVKEGDAIYVSLLSGPDFVGCFYALASLSAIAVLASSKMTAYELTPVMGDASCVGAVIADSKASELLANCQGMRFVMLADEKGLPPSTQATRMVTLKDFPNRISGLVAPRNDAVISYHFTYKGLGYPLVVPHTYSQYSYPLREAIACYPHTQGQVLLMVLPTYPVYGLLTGVLKPLASGERVVYVRRVDPAQILELLIQYHARFAAFVPLLYSNICWMAAGGGKNKAALRQTLHPELELFSGGSAMSLELLAAVQDVLGIEVTEGYGTTETLPILGPCGGRRGRRGTLGLPSIGSQVAIVDANGCQVRPGAVGEIVLRGPGVATEFLKRPKETAQFFRNGWFRTGDLGHVECEGYVYFDGRALPFTKSASQMVDLVEVEQVLLRNPGVRQARASVRHDPWTGEAVAVSVVLQPGATLGVSEVTDHCGRFLSRYKVPRIVTFSEQPAMNVTRQ